MMQIQVVDAKGTVLNSSHESGAGVALVHLLPYQTGDRILIHVEKSGLYTLQLDESMGKCEVYLQEHASYEVPIDPLQKTCFPLQAFNGDKHLLTLERAENRYRNLALNPYDNHHTKGMYPHATANVETRNEMVFAARNAIDGILENRSHGDYPYASWGINQNPEAELSLDFGRAVIIDQVRITLRADWPHDSWWTDATLTFSDGETYLCKLEKNPLPQRFDVGERIITGIKMGKLIKADDASPFPALTQIEVFGREIPEKQEN